MELLIDTGIRGPRRKDGKAGYVLVYRTEGKAADINKIIDYKDATEHESLTRVLLEALKRLRVPVYLEICTDALYIQRVLMEWLPQWKANGWTNKKGKPVQEEWAQIEEILNAHEFDVCINKRNEYSQWLESEVRK